MKRKLLQTSNIFLIAALTLLSLVSPTGTGASGPQTVPATTGPAQTIDPTPLYSITWTATGTGSSDVTEYDTRTVQSRKIVMAGSGIFRTNAANEFDNFPFDLTVTDDYDRVIIFPCYGGPVISREHWRDSITDPSRYTGGPIKGIYIPERRQRDDGSWWMYGPTGFDGFSYIYREDHDWEGCPLWSPPGSESHTYEGGGYGIIVYEPGGGYAPGILEGDDQGKVFTTTTQFVDGWMTYQWDVTVRLLDGRDLTVDRLEVTQGLQDGANTLPLIQGRRTVVRAYLGIGQDQIPVPNVTGKLSGYAGTTLLGSVPPFNPGGRITAPVNPNWMQIDDTLNFELPYDWTLQPNLRLEVEVNPYHSVAENNFNNNKLDTLLPFLPCGEVSVAYLPIHYTPPDDFSPADPSANINVGAEFMKKIYPVSQRGLKYFMYPDFELTLESNININGAKEFTATLLKNLLSTGPVRAGHIYGWLPEHAYSHGGSSENPGVAAFGNDTKTPDAWRVIFAHEIGHNLDLDQAASSLTTAGRHWFDVFERVIKPGAPVLGGKDLIDFMAGDEEANVWISPQNYEKLVKKICSGGTGSVTAPTQPLAVVDSLLVTGVINNTTPVASSLEPLYHFTTVPTYILPLGSQACVNLKDTAGTLLSQYCFDPGFTDESGTPAEAMPFGMVVPYPAGLNRVELVKAGAILATQIASSNPPSVSVTFPNAAGLTLSGPQDITWTGTDADGGTLTYNILYSRDNGATWVGIRNGITGNTDNLDFSGLPGTTGASGLIKVMVSDGFYSAEDLSDNPFTVENKPPEAAIISPPSGAVFTTGPQVVLEGAGMDLEDGSLGDSALSWVSSLDGALGASQLLEVTLSPGVHTITLTATDSGGLSGVASIQITVVQPAPLNYLFLPIIKR